jgi:Tat protein translocase TatB subunit
MFDLGMQEILIVLVVALVFIGPRRLPEIARTLGRAFIELRRAGEELKGQIDLASIMEEPERSTSLKEGEDSRVEEEESHPSTSPIPPADQQEREPKAPHEAQAEASQKTET